LLRSGPLYRAAHESRDGRERLERFAQVTGIDAGSIEVLLALGARPTLENLAHTFARLYLDRVVASIALGGGLAAIGAGARAAGTAVASFGALLMAASWARGHDRYSGNVATLLTESARRVGNATGARLVVFGHTHREASADGYANTGSFAFPRGAP